MLPVHQIRLPLQSGTTAVWSLARIAATLFPGLLLLDGSLNLFLAPRNSSWTHRALQAPWLLEAIDPSWISQLTQASMLWHFLLGTALTGGVALLGFCWLHLHQLWRTRPSDIVISPWGVQIQRWGRETSHHWEDIAGTRCFVEEELAQRTTIFSIVLQILGRRSSTAEVPIWRLKVPSPEGDWYTLAEAERPIERESLAAICDTVRASDLDDPVAEPDQDPSAPAQPSSLPPATVGPGPRTLRCANCHGLVAPEEVPHKICEYCGQEVSIPEPVRSLMASVRQRAAGRRAQARVIGDLLAQPGAGRTSALMLSAVAPMFAAWPLAAVLIYQFQSAARLDLPLAGALVAAPPALILGIFFLLRAHVANRQALRLLTLHFGARPPEHQNEPHGCRCCGGPLPRSEDPLVACAFCGADNILSLDLRRQVLPAPGQHKAVDAALRQRQRERRLWSALTVVAMLLVALGVAAVVYPFL